MSTRKTTIVILVLVVAAAITGVVLAMIFANDTQPTSGSIEIPAADTAGSESTETVASMEPSSGVDPATTVDDPVPDGVVSELFGIIEAQGDEPTMNEQYTVEFVEDTEHVRLSGTFENGEATYEFEYDDGAWKLDSTDE